MTSPPIVDPTLLRSRDVRNKDITISRFSTRVRWTIQQSSLLIEFLSFRATRTTVFFYTDARKQEPRHRWTSSAFSALCSTSMGIWARKPGQGKRRYFVSTPESSQPVPNQDIQRAQRTNPTRQTARSLFTANHNPFSWADGRKYDIYHISSAKHRWYTAKAAGNPQLCFRGPLVSHLRESTDSRVAIYYG